MAIPLLLAGAQAAVGIGQSISGYQKLKNLTRPEYQIPAEIEQNMSEAELMSYYGMPDAQKQSYMQNIQRAGQQALSGIADRKGGLGMVSAVQQQQQDSYMNLLSADVQQRMQNIQAAQQARQVMAQYKDKAFQMNEMEPYTQDYNEAQAQIGAGMQNIMGGLQAGAQSMMLKDAFNTGDVVDDVVKKSFGETALGGFLQSQGQKLLNNIIPPQNFMSQGDGTSYTAPTSSINIGGTSYTGSQPYLNQNANMPAGYNPFENTNTNPIIFQ
jgi:hypothetical protein